MATESAKHGLRLQLGTGGPIVTIGPAGDEAPLPCTLDRKMGLWTIPGPSRAVGGIVLRVWPDEASRNDAHPDELTQLYVKEVHDKSALSVRWEGGPVVAEGFDTDDDGASSITKATAGVVRLQHRDGILPIAIVPRNLLEGGAFDADTVRAAMRRLFTMVAELAQDVDERDYVNPSEAPGTYIGSDADTSEAAKGASGRKRSDSFYQAFRRLDQLLRKGGVEEAWQALMADPVVRLQNTYPVVPMARARAPVVSGNRGPWTLAQGWNPHRPDGDVRSRTVVRTGDTPPNRLAVGLARRVLEELSRLERAYRVVRPDAGGSWGPFEHRRRAMRATAQAVLAAPAFADVDRNAPVPLDSPALQLNARCRPLLRAWARLDRPLRNPGDLPLDDVMLQPLAHTYELYERWCFVALCRAALRHGAQERPRPTAPGRVLHRVFERSDAAHVRTLHVLASASSLGEKQSARQEYLSPAGGQSARRTDWQHIVRSWSAPTLPDGLLIVERTPVGNPEAPVARVLVWDAKYRKLPKRQWESGLLYQAHAFRDCLAVRAFWRTGPRAAWKAAKRVRWSIVLHPGPALQRPVYRCDGRDRFTGSVPRHALDALGPRHAGVGIVSAAPRAANDGAPDEVAQVVGQLLEREGKP